MISVFYGPSAFLSIRHKIPLLIDPNDGPHAEGPLFNHT